MLISMAQGGKLQQKVDDNTMKQYLDQIALNASDAGPQKITIQRKKYQDDSDEDEEYDL